MLCDPSSRNHSWTCHMNENIPKDARLNFPDRVGPSGLVVRPQQDSCLDAQLLEMKCDDR